MSVQATTRAVPSSDFPGFHPVPEIIDLDPAHDRRAWLFASSCRTRPDVSQGCGRQHGKAPQARVGRFHDSLRCKHRLSMGITEMKEPRPTEVEAGSDQRRRCRCVQEKTSWSHVIAADVAVGNEARGDQMAPCWPTSPWRRARVSQTDSPPGY